MRVVNPAVRAAMLGVLALVGTTACSRSSEATASAPPREALAKAPARSLPKTSTQRATPVATRAGDWNGRYTYEFSDGANAAGTAVTATYTLALTPSSCRFTAEGYQIDEQVVCLARPVANGIDIAFQSYAGGAMTDRYGNAVYAAGDPLFSLGRRDDKIVTRWKGYALPDDKPHAPGVYFTR